MIKESINRGDVGCTDTKGNLYVFFFFFLITLFTYLFCINGFFYFIDTLENRFMNLKRNFNRMSRDQK